MNPFITWGLIGLGSGIIIFPIFLKLYLIIRNAKERRMIKKMMKKGQFLVPIDPKDYNVEAWKNQKYGNINPEEQKPYLDNLNLKLFKKSVESSDDSFMLKIRDYIKEARKLGYSDEQIKEEFKKKSYTEELINKVF